MVMPRHQPAFLDFADKIEHFLRASDRERWNDKVSAAVQRFLYVPCQLRFVIRRGIMGAVAVGTFHDDIISRFCKMRVVYDGLVDIADIAGKYYFFSYSVFRQPYFHAGRA